MEPGWYVNQLLREMAFFFFFIMWHPMKMQCSYIVWFSGKIIALKPCESPLRCSERTRWNQMSSAGTSWSTTSIKWISYCLLTHRVTIVHVGSLSITFQNELDMKSISTSCPSPSLLRLSWHICQAAEAVTCQVTTWPLVSWGWLWVMR